MKLSELFSHWEAIHRDTLTLVDQFSEAELAYTAYDSGWSVGQIALHIAAAEEGWFRLIATKERDQWPDDFTLANHPTREAIKTVLAETHARTATYLATQTADDLDAQIESPWGRFSLRFIIWHVIEHEIHHRGELSLVLGILGREGLDV